MTEAVSIIESNIVESTGKIIQLNHHMSNTEHWLLSSLDKFAETMYFQENQTLNAWGDNFLQQLIPYVSGLQATLYYKKDEILCYASGYAIDDITKTKTEIPIGEGLVGLVAQRNEMTYLTSQNISYKPHLATVDFAIEALLILPLSFNKKICGVLEIIFLNKPEQKYIDLLLKLSERIAANLNTLLIMARLEESHQVIEAKNHNITASINYAKRIQNTFLPSKSQRLAIFPHSFVIYEPLDIVSGDFFWISSYENIKIACVADCTGHGVPAAFMSLLGHSLLNEAIIQKNILSPAEIVKYIHNGIYNRLNTGKENLRDGMDLGICFIEKIDEKQTKIVYSGAKQSVFIISEGKVKKYSGSRMSLGYSKDFTAEDNTFYLTEGDMIYLTTDGYIDQANPQRRRFGSPSFIALIEQVQKEPMQMQKQILTETLEIFMEGTKQRDDITVLAIKL